MTELPIGLIRLLPASDLAPVVMIAEQFSLSGPISVEGIWKSFRNDPVLKIETNYKDFTDMQLNRIHPFCINMLCLRYRTPACSDDITYWKALTEGVRGRVRALFRVSCFIGIPGF